MSLVRWIGLSCLFVGCVTTGVDLGSSKTDFYYESTFSTDYYTVKGRGTQALYRNTVYPNVITPHTLFELDMKRDHYWPMATAELNSDVRNLFIIQVMRDYVASFDFYPPIDPHRTPSYKPFIEYGMRAEPELAEEDHTADMKRVYGETLDDKAMLLYLEALELKFESQPALLDFHANQCFAGFTPADAKRSRLNPPATHKECAALFQTLKPYIPVVQGVTVTPTKDDKLFGQVITDFKFIDGMDANSEFGKFFNDERVSSRLKRELAIKLKRQLETSHIVAYESAGGLAVSPTGTDHYVYALSANAKYLFGSDPEAILHFQYFDVAMAHDYVQYFVMGLNQVSPVRFSGEYNQLYSSMVGPNNHSSVLYRPPGSEAARNIYPSPNIECLQNIGQQSVSLPRAIRMAYYCRTSQPDQQKVLDLDKKQIFTRETHATALTVRLSSRIVEPTDDDLYPTTFITILPTAPNGLSAAILANQSPNAFVSRVISLNGVSYGYVQHQGIEYYIDLRNLSVFLDKYL